MAVTKESIQRLKSQLLTSSLSKYNQPLFQVINQLIDAVGQSVGDSASALESSGLVGPTGATGLTGLTGPPGLDGMGSEIESVIESMGPSVPYDFYKTGEWLPIIGGSTSEAGQTYSVQSGWYVKVGRLVYIGFNAQLSVKGAIVGSIYIKNLPFIGATNPVENAYCTMGWANTVSAYVGVSGFQLASSTSIFLFAMTAAATGSFTTGLSTADLNNNTQFAGTCCYRTVA